MKKAFVYVACGELKHTERLYLSIKSLRKHSSLPVFVLTDQKRNEKPVDCPNLIDIETPAHFDNHQASIFLKTNLHNYLPEIDSTTYCYLDTDVLALSVQVDKVFDHYSAPVLFARDHCPLNEFSVDAMRCNCRDDFQERKDSYYAMMEKFFPGFRHWDEDIVAQNKALLQQFETLKNKPFKTLFANISYVLTRYILPLKSFRFGEFVFDKKKRTWHNEKQEIIGFDYAFYKDSIRKETGIWYDESKNAWFNENNEDITPRTAACDHLAEYLSEKYELNIASDWRHWNGGLFLFSNESKDFMDMWNKISLAEFDEEKTYTRDQLALIVCAWKFGLQQKDCLSSEFNFIADYDDASLKYEEGKGFYTAKEEDFTKPAFIHIYAHWGDEEWDVWKQAKRLSV